MIYDYFWFFYLLLMVSYFLLLFFVSVFQCSPTVFKSKQVSATSNELVNSIAMGKCLSTIAIQVGTSVLSEDPSQVRKLIMSLWVSVCFFCASSS